VKIESIIQNINTVAVKGQAESSVSNNSATNSKLAKEKAGLLVTLKNMNTSIREGLNDKQQNRDKQSLNVEDGLFDLKAVFALDKEKNVVIRVLDKKGEIVRQYPPEEYINMIKKFRENIENLFSKEV
jgi:uncharacterized FlaG/YvyC family protein